jgi:hypothetical protein
MKRLLSNVLAGVLVCTGLALAAATICQPLTAAAATAPADDAQAIQQADHALVAALAKGDKAAAEKMFDTEFLWTNPNGDTFSRTKVLAVLPKPALGDESSAQATERGYGPDVAAVQVSSGKVHVLRIWAKRPAGWRLLVYHEVTQRSGAAPPPLPTTNDCENPCKGVLPYTPKDDAEKGVLKSWVELETAALAHDPKAWVPHVVDEFVLVSSGGTDPVDKAGRLAQLSKPGFGPAPPQLAKTPAVKFIHFGDTVIMIAQANPYAGKPNHISRIWVNRDGMWRMAFSYQTTVQSAPEIVPPKS